MLVPISWLKNYVPVTDSPHELAHKLTMAGIEIGEVRVIGGDWDPEKVVVGHVVRVDPHPNADRLSLPTVDTGDGGTATVVCGAPNVAAGQKIAFARAGARLFSPHSGKVETLKRARIRGVESAGMVCSPLELGLGEDHDGILVLGRRGTRLAHHFRTTLGDAVLDAEVTSNRPDCLSILGIAHEVAAINWRERDRAGLHLSPSLREDIEEPGDHRDSRPRPLLSLHCQPDYRREDRLISAVAEGRADQGGPASHQQRRGHHQLCHAGVRPAAARLRFRHVQRPHNSRQGGPRRRDC